VAQYFAYIASYALCTFVKTAGATYPKKYLRFLALCGHFGHGWDS
jgi:hypothetical protein